MFVGKSLKSSVMLKRGHSVKSRQKDTHSDIDISDKLCHQLKMRRQQQSTLTKAESHIYVIMILASLTLLIRPVFLCSSSYREPAKIFPRPMSKRDHDNIGCRSSNRLALDGEQKQHFSRLDRVCQDCRDTFRDEKIYLECRKSCFTSDHFKGCVEVIQENMTSYEASVKILNDGNT
ncbi:hypothetical protein QAD02_000367 [Eretmocerus hayati]|uniref:Uncharacterized protein n=1 Tax=Eretmocerus hayati TaxID=131215 RepID=A0ACC2NEB5_9HYME|nr:hypothetical protein QAD02_000367 [Eretmocerus hayati]